MWNAAAYYAILAAEALLGIFGIRLYEEAPYEVLTRLGRRLEIRRYGPRMAVEARLPTAESQHGDARNEAFNLLFAYIAGANHGAPLQRGGVESIAPVAASRTERIAMTVPVQTLETSGELYMQFFMPARFDISNAPQPADARLRLCERPTETIATLRFNGTARDLLRREAELTSMLSSWRWRPVGQPCVLFYDAPFTIPCLRRTEIAVPVSEAREALR